MASTSPAAAIGNGVANVRDKRAARPVTVPDFLSARSRGVKLTMLTVYDYTMARLLDESGVDSILISPRRMLRNQLEGAGS